MNYFTMNCYEMKREIITFAEKMTKGTRKTTKKFVSDMMYGINASGSIIMTEIARKLKEKNKIKNTEERLVDHINKTKEEELKQIKENYKKEIKKYIGEEVIVIHDDSDIEKEYGKKFEDIDIVVDGSSIEKKKVKGYHECEAVVLSKKEKQPISIYSKIYSSKSKGYKSANTYTKEAIKESQEYGEKRIHVMDRGYDSRKVFQYINKIGDKFVIRVKGNRNMKFKGQNKNILEVAKARKGKIIMAIKFQKEEKEVMISYTKATILETEEEYTLVFVYGIGQEPMLLITNIDIKEKEEAIKVVKLYISRWKIEEYFRAKKQEYDFENIRIRKLKGINTLNMMLTISMGQVSMIAEKVNEKLLSIKIIEMSKGIRGKIVIWLSQIARGIKEILSYAKEGIKRWEKIEHREQTKQLKLKI